MGGPIEERVAEDGKPGSGGAPGGPYRSVEPEAKVSKPVSIWTWVGMVLVVYGLIVTSMGVLFVFRPETETATAHLNPSLWWGLLMVAAAALFLWLGRRERSRG
jgi:hypothetical protein